MRNWSVCAALVLAASCGGGGSGSPTAPSAPALNLGGNYLLTVHAGGSCFASLPDSIRQRSYNVSVLHEAQTNQMAIQLAANVGGIDAIFLGIVNTANRTVTGPFQLYDPPNLRGYVAIGGATLLYGSSNSSLQSGTLNGGVGIGILDACSSSDHRLFFERR